MTTRDTRSTLAATIPRARPAIPDRIERLWEFALNLSWTWDRDARALFRSIDFPLWRMTRHNPVDLLLRVSPERLSELASNETFLERYRAVVGRVEQESSSEHTWFTHHYPDLTDRPIAYFCAEFGLHNSVPIYSGGLGILAGDHCKAASDLGVPLVGLGLLYTRGYFDQTLRLDGWQEDGDETFDPARTALEPLPGPNGEPYLTWVYGAGRRIYVGAWRVRVGRVPIYLLDTDLEENKPADRELSHKLYAGGADLRLRQEGLLGIGGVRVLKALGIEPAAWHANEGHAAFMLVERVRQLLEQDIPLDEAVASVRANSIFTTHTPVPAGHDIFTHQQIRNWDGPYTDERPEPRKLLSLGVHPEMDGNRFHMTAAGIRLSRRVNGVSERHGHVTREIWQSLWKGREPEDVPIGHVTNGVHLANWMNNEMMALFDLHLGSDWGLRLDEPEMWEGVHSIPDEELWALHQRLKIGLIDFVREEARRRWRDHWEEAAHLVGAGTLLGPFALTLGFARRFATYKRADLLFQDVERFLEKLSDPWRPVQLVFAGKAHPQDEMGKEVLQRVYSRTRDQRFEGRIAFLEDYGMHLAHRLIAGVDLWINLPRVPLEASGTSGMKAALNGVPQLGTEDGWWEEGFTGANGWSIPAADRESDEQEIDVHDADHLYRILEDEVIPLFYDRDARGIPVAWVQRMKAALIIAGQRFTARRMVQEYARDFYVPALRGEREGDDPPTA